MTIGVGSNPVTPAFLGGSTPTIGPLRPAITRARVKEKANLPTIVAYSIRHKMTSVLRRSGVPEDQIALQLGHKRPLVRTTGLYGEFAPSYLAEAQAAIDAFMVRLQGMTGRALFPTVAKAASGNNRIVLLR